MGWEKRERGAASYYTRSKRQDGRVIREYVGGGVLGQVAAQLDEYERRRREEQSRFWREEQERLQRNAAFLDEIAAAADTLVRAHLSACGFRQRKGEWRRQREQST